MELAECLKYAKRVAFNMSKDPEVESIAGMSAWTAHRTFDPERGVPIERWVALITKRDIWGYWRSMKIRKAVTCSFQFDEDEVDITPASYDTTSVDIPQEEWMILVDNHLNGIPLDVLARRWGCSTGDMKKFIRAAEQRFKDAIERS